EGITRAFPTITRLTSLLVVPSTEFSPPRAAPPALSVRSVYLGVWTPSVAVSPVLGAAHERPTKVSEQTMFQPSTLLLVVLTALTAAEFVSRLTYRPARLQRAVRR